MATKSTKPAATVKPTVTETPVTPTTSTAWQRVNAAMDDLLTEQGAPTRVRLICAYVLGFVGAAFTGFVLSKVVDAIVLGAVLLSGSALFGMLIWVMGLVLSAYACMHAFSAGFGYAVSDVCTNHIAHMRGARNTVVGWFSRKEPAHA